MDVKFPGLNGGSEYILSGKQSAVLIGANGAGKTRMSTWIEKINQGKNQFVHRISAQKDLGFPVSVNTGNIDILRNKFFFGAEQLENPYDSERAKYFKDSYRWYNHPFSSVLNDKEALLGLLFSEDYEFITDSWRRLEKNGDQGKNLSVKDLGQSNLRKTISIASQLLKGREFSINANYIACKRYLDSKDEEYNISDGSDGEREVIYLIGAVLSIPENSIVIVDEPENHLHKSIVLHLWDILEKQRPDCFFLYITHDLEFAKSRTNSQIIWVKEYLGSNNWDYCFLEDEPAMDELALQLLGTRNNVLLVEGYKDSNDVKLYSRLFSKWTVIPCGSCEQVIKGVKFVREHDKLFGIKVLGITDRDRLTDAQVDNYFRENIIVPNVAEVENLFLVEEVLEIMCDHYYVDDKQHVVDSIISTALTKFGEMLESQILQHFQYQIQNLVIQGINNKSKTISEYRNQFTKVMESIDFDAVERDIRNDFENIQKQNSYKALLKVFNHKGLGKDLNLQKYLNVGYPSYKEVILRILSQDSPDELCNKLKKAFYSYFDKNALDLLLGTSDNL